MKRLVLIGLILAQFVVRPYVQPVQPQPQNQLKYNPMNSQWHYERPGDKLQYNPHDNSWGFARPGSEPQYNPHTNEWEQQK